MSISDEHMKLETFFLSNCVMMVMDVGRALEKVSPMLALTDMSDIIGVEQHLHPVRND